jgi:hypothetical protein
MVWEGTCPRCIRNRSRRAHDHPPLPSGAHPSR